MKWLGGDSGNGMLNHTNGHASSPHVIRQQAPETGRPQLARSQDDAMVGYMFQRPHSDPDFPLPPPFTKQHPRWALGDESIDPAAEHMVFVNNHMATQRLAAAVAASSHMQTTVHHLQQQHAQVGNGQCATSNLLLTEF